MSSPYDALLVVSFGGPEKPDDVMPFLENVLRGKNVPRERMLEVAEHYYHFGGRSPINDHNRELIARLREQVGVPVYWGNRNWEPYLADTVRQMQLDGIGNAAAFITSVFGSYSGCRQYLEDIARAQEAAGGGLPDICALPLVFDREGFLGPMASNIGEAIGAFKSAPHVAFTAHSVPLSMAQSSPYVPQLNQACAAIAERLALSDWKLVYQSRSGPPGQPWLEPDIGDHIRALHQAGVGELVIAPIGFVSDHMEVLYDLDTEAAALCEQLGMRMMRARTVGTHPDFVRMVAGLLDEPCRQCAPDCCPRPQRPAPPKA